MRQKQARPDKIQRGYRNYSPSAMTNAYKTVLAKSMSVRRAAIQYKVPENTLRQRVLGRVDFERSASGPLPVLNQYEEARLVKQLKAMASVGYGYTRSEVVDMASDYALYLHKRDKDSPFSIKWFHNFMKRWPELDVKKPRSLAVARAKATSEEVVRTYFSDLEKVLVKYNLKDKPHHLYNVDEKGLQTEHSPPYVVGPRDTNVQAVTSPRSGLTTVIGCGNALGCQIPPYFIFKGARMRQELLTGCSVGADGDVSKSGWSNSTTFKTYIESHFLKYVQGKSDDDYIMLFYDGARTHISVPLINWAIQHRVILFVLPAHTSHVLQPLDVGCFGPFQKIYNNQCHKYIRENHASTVTRYNVAELACKAYVKALSPENLQNSFRRSGIYPFSPSAVDSVQFAPSIPFTAQADEVVETPDNSENPAVEESVTVAVDNSPEQANQFFARKLEPITKKHSSVSTVKSRRNISHVVSGKPITEPDILHEIELYIASGSKTAKCTPSEKKCSKPINVSVPSKRQQSPQPGPSAIRIQSEDTESDSDDDSDISDEEKCCVCHQFTPKELQNCVSVVFTQWAQCNYERCQHWTHLKYCCEQRVVRLHEDFHCPCHI